MKHLLPISLVVILTAITFIFIGNTECMVIGEGWVANISLGTCDMSSAQTSISNAQNNVSVYLTMFWLIANIMFAFVYPKPDIANIYKISLFILGLPFTIFIYLIAHLSLTILRKS